MTKMIDISTHDGKKFSAYLAVPETDIPAPAVIVIQEIFGVNAVMRGICDNLAQAGYLAVCPDLFWRIEPNISLTDKTEAEWAKAFDLFKKFNVDLGIEDLKSTLSFMRTYKDCTGKVGTVGYCLGGKLAYLMATRSDADCNIGYYGVGIETLLDEARNIKKPLMLHIAERDKFVPFEAQRDILTALKTNRHALVHVYPDVDHAFAREGGEHYDKEAAHQANYRTADFLANCIGKR